MESVQSAYIDKKSLKVKANKDISVDPDAKAWL